MYLTQSRHRGPPQNPDRVAIIRRDRVRTVAESVNRIACLAGVLMSVGVQRGDRVGILTLNSDLRHMPTKFVVPTISPVTAPLLMPRLPGWSIKWLKKSSGGNR